MSQFLNSLNEVRKNYKIYDEWEQKQADERAKKEYLATNLKIPDDKIELTKKRAEAIVRAAEIMDARSEDNCQDVEQMTQLISLAPPIAIPFAVPFIQQKVQNYYDKKFEKEIKNAKNNEELILSLSNKRTKLIKRLTIGSVVANISLIFLTTIGLILWGNSKQKEASRIGRFQAKHDELKGLENFIVYTPQQLEKAQEIAKNIPDEKERKGIFKMIDELKAISKDKIAYKKWLDERDPNEIEKLKQIQLLPEQAKQAQTDKELIIDTVKEINIKAEEYAENVENTYDTLSAISWLLTIPSMMGLNKIFNAVKASPIVRKTASIAVPVLISVGISLKGSFEEKTASRIGRFKARQEILSNPQRLMAFSEEEMKKAEHIKAADQKQGFFKKIADNFRFLGTYRKDKKEYKEYKETTQKENEKLQKAFKGIETTEQQKAEAKALKKNMFRAFDEIDEMSQRYSEDTEAGTEIAKESFTTIWGFGSLAASIGFGIALTKGKLPITRLVNKIVNIAFKSDSSLKKAVNELYSELNKSGKEKITEFQKSLIRGRFQSFFENEKNPTLNKAAINLMMEISNNCAPVILRLQTNKGATLATDLANAFAPHLKDTLIAKWARNMIVQIGKILINTKVLTYNNIKAMGIDYNEIAEIKKTAGLNFSYKNYKTLIDTGIVTGIPILGTIFAIPYAFNAWLTNIQKKAGKIGIMKAMDNIDDPRIFASEIKTPQQSQNTQDKPKSTNLLEQLTSK